MRSSSRRNSATVGVVAAPAFVDAEIRKRGQRRQAASRFGAIGAEQACAVAGEVDAAHAAAAVGIDARQPLPALRFEHELAARQVGELRLGPQMPSERDGLGFEAPLAALRVAHAHRGGAACLVAVDGQRLQRRAAAERRGA